MTNATICTIIDDDVRGIYINVDELQEDLGDFLQDNFYDYDMVVQLIEHGDVSFLGESIEDCKFFSDLCEEDEDYEPRTEPAFSPTDFVREYGQDFNYFFNPDTDNWEIL
jgi:hypothetical protein